MSQKASTVPAVMKVAELHDIDDLRIVEYPTPTLQPGELLVHIVASGICSGDLMPWYIRKKAPLVLGHEPAGVVVAIGGDSAIEIPGKKTFAVGDRVALHHHAPCLQCPACLREAYVHCATWRATRLDPGGIAEYIRVPVANLVDTWHLPDHLGWDEAVLLEPLGCVMKSLRRARLRPGDTVYVIGLGIMGLLHVAVARSRGYAVVASDFLAKRRQQAALLGATVVVEPSEAMRAFSDLGTPDGAQVVICGPGSAEAFKHACLSAASDGVVVMFTPCAPDERFELDQSRLYFRDISLVASYSCGPNDTAQALAWLSEAHVSAAQFGALPFPLSQTAEAYTLMRQAVIIKAIVQL